MEQIFMALIDKLDAFYAFLLIVVLIVVWVLFKIMKDTRERVEIRTEQFAKIELEQKQQSARIEDLHKNDREIFVELRKLISQLSEVVGACKARHK